MDKEAKNNTSRRAGISALSVILILLLAYIIAFNVMVGSVTEMEYETQIIDGTQYYVYHEDNFMFEFTLQTCEDHINSIFRMKPFKDPSTQVLYYVNENGARAFLDEYGLQLRSEILGKLNRMDNLQF